MNLLDIRKSVNKKLTEFQMARTRFREESKALEEAQERRTTLKEGQVVVQTTARLVQEEAHKQIADIVSRSLEAVFDQPYRFKIIFEQKRGRTEARLVFERNGMEVDPISASGGGCIDVAAFALRLSCLMLSRPPLRRLLVLDEPFKFLSTEYRGRVRELLELLAKELGVQMLIVTHIKELECGKVIQL